MKATDATDDAVTITSPRITGAEGDSISQALAQAVANAPLQSSPRVQLTTEVDFSSDSNFYSGFSTDVADGGLFLATLSLLPVGSTVTVKFTIPGTGEVEAKGEVRWVRALDERAPNMFPGMGIRFLELSPRSRELISAFVTQREPMFFPD